MSSRRLDIGERRKSCPFSDCQLSGRPLKVNYPKLTVIRGVEHTVSLFFNDVSKIPILDKMIDI